MNITSKAKKAAVAAGALAVLGAAAVVGTAGSASAAVPTATFKVCAFGDYAAYADIPQQGGIATVVISPGHCGRLPVVPGTTYAEVWGLTGFDNAHHGRKFLVGKATFDPRTGWTGAAMGTTTRHYLVSADPAKPTVPGGAEHR